MSSAVTIMGGLTFATVLTLIVVPVLYCTFYRVNKDSKPISAEEPVETAVQPEPVMIGN